MALRLPPLSGLRLFEAAARCGSFKRAAQELNLTPGALSHGIDSLEQWLDVELFGRKARGVILTPTGRQYLPYISEALSMIATGTLRLPSRRFEDRLSISSTSLFAYKVLLPRLHKFREMYPNMVVTVEASRQIVSLPSDQFDLAIRNSREPWPKLSCDLLGRIRFVPVGSPRYIAGRTWPCDRPSADHRRRYRGRSSCDRGRSRCSGHERLLAGQAAGPRNTPRDRVRRHRGCVDRRAAPKHGAAGLGRARRQSDRVTIGCARHYYTDIRPFSVTSSPTVVGRKGCSKLGPHHMKGGAPWTWR